MQTPRASTTPSSMVSSGAKSRSTYTSAPRKTFWPIAAPRERSSTMRGSSAKAGTLPLVHARGHLRGLVVNVPDAAHRIGTHGEDVCNVDLIEGHAMGQILRALDERRQHGVRGRSQAHDERELDDEQPCVRVEAAAFVGRGRPAAIDPVALADAGEEL